MPTIMTHAVVPLVLAYAAGRDKVPGKLMAVGLVLAMLPDLDVVGFRLGVAYGDQLGHRGASHSLLVAVLFAGLPVVLLRPANRLIAFAFLTLSMASHGLLDMLTNGGMGVALFWPFEVERHFFAVTPVKVSPIGAGFFSDRGLAVMASEVQWIWLPAAVILGASLLARRVFDRRI